MLAYLACRPAMTATWEDVDSAGMVGYADEDELVVYSITVGGCWILKLRYLTHCLALRYVVSPPRIRKYACRYSIHGTVTTLPSRLRMQKLSWDAVIIRC